MKDVDRLLVVMRLLTVRLVRWIFPADMQLHGILHDPHYDAMVRG